MYSKWRERLRKAVGFRLAWWYALVFTASAVALVGISYVLLAATLRQYDREIVQTTLVQFASAYARGGVDGLDPRDPADAGQRCRRSAAGAHASATGRTSST